MKLLKIWMYALGSYSDDKTQPYDKYMVVVRSAWVMLQITTCLFIIIGNGRIQTVVTVTKEHKKKWGSQFSDRDNSFDDDEDIKFFIQHTTTDRGLQSLILRNLPERGNYEWVGKPDNKYGIDLALVDKDTREKILLVDLERWGEWGSAKNNYGIVALSTTDIYIF